MPNVLLSGVGNYMQGLVVPDVTGAARHVTTSPIDVLQSQPVADTPVTDAVSASTVTSNASWIPSTITNWIEDKSATVIIFLGSILFGVAIVLLGLYTITKD